MFFHFSKKIKLLQYLVIALEPNNEPDVPVELADVHYSQILPNPQMRGTQILTNPNGLLHPNFANNKNKSLHPTPNNKFELSLAKHWLNNIDI